VARELRSYKKDFVDSGETVLQEYVRRAKKGAALREESLLEMGGANSEEIKFETLKCRTALGRQ
jgi:hypothetical protein